MTKLLDTTLRDGSYVINFQFTPKDTSLIAAGLDAAGVDFIELGHGLGLRAGTKDNMKAPYPDEAYLEAAGSAVQRAKWGMFFIPGIGKMEDIELAAKYGMDFIRIGTNVNEMEESESYIRRAKELGMYVASNFMKTYALSAEEVGKKAAKAASFGSDIVCIVDSAGGMFPEDVEQYYTHIRNNTDLAVGFHGHNNLGLAIANTLKAVELGCEVVDTSIRGMGRSSGNTVTEIFLLTLKRKGIDLGIDITRILDIAEKVIDPMLKNYQQLDSIGIISGYAQFHSSFLGTIFQYAKLYNVDPRELIVEVSKEDRINAPKELVESIASSLANEKRQIKRVEVNLGSAKAATISGMAENAERVAKETEILAEKFNRHSVFNIVQSYRNKEAGYVSQAIHEGSEFMVCSAEVVIDSEAATIAKAIDGKVDFILLDADEKHSSSRAIVETVKQNIQHSRVLIYSDLEAWADSVVYLANELTKGDYSRYKVFIAGDNILSSLCNEKLKILGAEISKGDEGMSREPEKDVLYILCEQVKGGKLRDLSENDIVIDAFIGSIEEDAIAANKLNIYRTDMQFSIHSKLSALAGYATLVSEKQGMRVLEDIRIAGGGLIAPRGTVIVDSVTKPSKVFGVADGRGFLISPEAYGPEDTQNVQKIENFIYAALV